MTRDEWFRVKEIAADALAKPEAERASYIAERCGAETPLCREVQSLLDSVAKAEPLYETPLFTTTAVLGLLSDVEEKPNPMIGGRIGAYRVLAEIGRGGMGAAYLAVRDDEVYEKRVALKLIKRGMDTDAILRRFRHERQILANLEHPNIVMLLDGGTTQDGLPYFVMEYVDGVAIDTYCDANRLPIAERLRLFQAVCDAVHHAHEQRVVHRDLKPSNILVTTRGIPKLLDFGIAKLLDSEQGSHTVEPTMLARAMTPQYASPEQIRGEPLTLSSDVYSLGVLLYVLLAGRHPYRLDGRPPRDAERIVCEAAPARPSAVADAAASECRGERLAQLRRRLAGDLDTIVLTALRKDPDRRYATARALSDDIQRHLDGQRIAAQSDRLGDVFAWTKRRGIRLAAGALAVLLAVVATVMSRYASPGTSMEVPQAIAVLPFSNTGGDPELDYLSDGITEEIINRLSRVPRLKVIARDSAYRYKDKEIDPQQVGRDLGVEAILTGRVARRDGSLSVAAELIDVRDRRQMWGDRYEQPVGDLQALEGELAQRIATNLQVQLSDRDQTRFTRGSTRNAEAYQAYLKGRYFWNKRTAAGMKTSVGYFKEAVEKDPSFALAYSGLADAYSLLTEYHEIPATDTYGDARSAVMKALEIDSDLPEAHISLAYVSQFYEWDWETAEREFKRALELNPNYATGHQWYAEYLSAMGRHAEALAQIRKAQEVDPLSLIINAVEANILYMAGDYDGAIEKCLEVIDMDPNFPEVYEYLKRSYDQKGRYQEAIAARQTRRRLVGLDATETPALRAAATTANPRVYWQKRVEQEIEESRKEGLQPFEFAELLAQSGDTLRALEWLERACRDHDFMMMYVRVAPNLEPLRSEPRYREIVRRSCRI